jgi:hypothetical protein
LSPEVAGIIGSLAGAVVGALIAWRSAIYVLRKQEKYKAGADFRSSFIEVLRLLDIKHPNHSQEYQSAYNLLKSQYKELYRAALTFEQSLGPSELNGFKNTWREFCSFDCVHSDPTFIDCVVLNANHDVEVQKRALARDRIERLLMYAHVK